MIYTVPTAETKLSTLVDRDNPYMEFLLLQAPKSNTIDINFGPVGDTNHFLEPGKSAYLPVKSLATYAVKAASGSQSIILSTL